MFREELSESSGKQLALTDKTETQRWPKHGRKVVEALDFRVLKGIIGMYKEVRMLCALIAFQNNLRCLSRF